MKQTGKCPKCGGTDIAVDAQVIDHGRNACYELTVATYGRPEALIFKDKRTTTVSAWICTACGFIELYADKPASI